MRGDMQKKFLIKKISEVLSRYHIRLDGWSKKNQTPSKFNERSIFFLRRKQWPANGYFYIIGKSKPPSEPAQFVDDALK